MTKKDNLIRAKIIKGLEIAHKKLIQAKRIAVEQIVEIVNALKREKVRSKK